MDCKGSEYDGLELNDKAFDVTGYWDPTLLALTESNPDKIVIIGEVPLLPKVGSDHTAPYLLRYANRHGGTFNLNVGK